MSQDEGTLKEKFLNAQSLFQKIDESSLSSNDPSFQTDVQTALGILHDCDLMIRGLAMFSSNETLEDVNSAELSLMLVDYYIAELELRLVDSLRLEHLKKSLIHTENFLDRLTSYSIFSAAELLPPTRTPEESRQQKIQRFKQEKALRLKASSLTQRLQDETTADDEITRELSTTLIKAAAYKAVESLESTKMEIGLLEGRAKMEEERKANGGDFSDKVEVNRPSNKKEFTNFVLTNRRDDIKKGVFRPGHNLPTMTIDEFLDREIERGNFLQGGVQPKKPDPDDMDEDAIDAETMKKREWDKFTDDNPRGWGNRHNKG
ncbi:hypothetical protein HDU97_001566 [Phlyctochytrium planicorne]|nr:hypothetical protein HDU97_001566 [Phlyctochytrium planicorne]